MAVISWLGRAACLIVISRVIKDNCACVDLLWLHAGCLTSLREETHLTPSPVHHPHTTFISLFSSKILHLFSIFIYNSALFLSFRRPTLTSTITGSLAALENSSNNVIEKQLELTAGTFHHRSHKRFVCLFDFTA